jgi:carbon starvation protein CstA
MITLALSVVLLVAGYLVYGRVAERFFGMDPSRETPAFTKNDSIDHVPMKGWCVFMIQFLNIAGLGPIFGAIPGAMYGPVVYIWIVVGCIFMGDTHDYFSGMLSVRHGGDELYGRCPRAKLCLHPSPCIQSGHKAGSCLACDGNMQAVAR